jgi:CHAT domain-containing protein/Tfp pilus assembly protein PilF
MIASKQGDLAKTAEYCHQALTLQEKISPDSLDVAASLNCLGNVELARRDLANSEKYNHQALTIFEKLSTSGPYVADNLNNLGLIALSKGDLNKAVEYQTQALKIQQEFEPDSQEVADILNNLGTIAWQQGDLDKAAAYLTHGLQIQQKLAPGGLDVADTVDRLGLIAWMQGDLARAGQSFGQALAIDEKLAPNGLSYALSLAAIAKITMQKGDLVAASQLYDEALTALENSPAQLGGSAEVRAGFRAQCADFYHDYIDLLVARHQPERALEILERWRARTLLETLAEGHVDIRKGIDSTLLEQKRSLDADIAAKSDHRLHLLSEEKPQEQLATLDREIDGLLSQYHDVEGQILANSPSYAALTQAHPLSVHELQLLLDGNTLLLEYSLGEERSYVFVVSSTSVTAYKLPGRAEIENLARNVYGLLTARGKTVKGETEQQQEKRWANADMQYAKSAARLSQAVLDPIAELLEQKRLLIVSDGVLQYIPFAALPTPKANQTVAAVDAPLALEHEIVNLPSASVLAELRREQTNRVEPPKSVVVLADPVFEDRDERVQGVRAVSRNANMKDTPTTLLSSTGEVSLSSDLLTRSLSDLGQKARDGKFYLSRLPYTRKEAKEILAVTPAGKGTEALDFQANRARAMDPSLGQYRIVHFATHGLLNNRHPELSGLVFSLVDKRGKPQDGFLTLQDIYNLDLPVDLVVLSGCKTGLGEEIDGEGLIGLTRGFMYAGASRVVASLWSVSDEATAELMARFYKAMEQEKMPPAAALRAAQVQMWRQKVWRAPYYWAAFQIQGEWK